MNIYYVAAIWLGMALLASVVSIRIAVPAALVEIVVGALAGNIPGIQRARHPDRRRHLPGQRGLAGADVPGRSGDRPGVAARALEGEPVHRPGLVRAAVPGRVRVLRPGPRLASARRRDRRHRAEHDLGRRGVRGHGRDRPEPSRPRQAHPGRLLHHRPGHRAGPRRPVRQLRLAAHRLRRGQRGHRGAAAPAAPAGDQVLRPPGLRAGDQAAAGRPVRARRAGHPGRQRGRPARLRRRAGRGRGVPARPGPDGPAALHRLRPAHPVLLPARRNAHLRPSADLRRRGDRRLCCWSSSPPR